jgi:multiple sugar transport system ATP-binding protein
MSLSLRHISKSFGKTLIFSDISLDVAEGETVVLFGPSGTGKTVLLRIVAGVEETDQGQIIIDHRDVTYASPDSRGVGMAFQNFALFPHLSAYDNVASALTAKERSTSVIRERVDAIVKLLKIDHVMGHSPRELSNGQKQRTALARALVGAPRVLLLDDPLRNVDAKLRYEMRLELPNLLRRFGSTVLYVTQDYKEAMALGHRIAVLQGASIVQLASPVQIYEQPRSLTVAKLFGDPTINALPVTLSAQDSDVVAEFEGVRFSLGRDYRVALGREAILGLRPEHISVSHSANAAALPVEVVAETPLNEKTVLLMRTKTGTELLASMPASEAGTIPVGPAFVTFDANAALLFDRSTEIYLSRAGQ